ncbi:hypothetical protein EG329_011127 [Mollisiaceae sp. DMI_Dod_QoI]|nr:hypothetical protein EG329_011127 [Helotiales sp. DMI_Dod_QoI]
MATTTISHLSSPSTAKYFLHHWTLTTPSHPSLKFHRATPLHIPVWLPIVTNPPNNALMDDIKDTIWDSTAINQWTTSTISRYSESLTTYTHLDILISEDDVVIGYANLMKLKSGSFNVGLVIDVAAQGRGIGKVSTRVLIQLAFEIGKSSKVEAGTMKANMAFRGVMRSLGVEEEEKLVVVEGRGVLAELSYTIEREKWKDVEFVVVWGGEGVKVDEAK